jgi:hypothetical protein
VIYETLPALYHYNAGILSRPLEAEAAEPAAAPEDTDDAEPAITREDTADAEIVAAFGEDDAN